MFPAETEVAFHQAKKKKKAQWLFINVVSKSWITLFSLGAYVGCQLQKDIMTWDRIWCNMIRCNAVYYKTVWDTMWYDTRRNEKIRCDTIKCDKMQHKIYKLLWCVTIWYNMTQHNIFQTLKYNTIWFYCQLTLTLIFYLWAEIYPKLKHIVTHIALFKDVQHLHTTQTVPVMTNELILWVRWLYYWAIWV